MRYTRSILAACTLALFAGCSGAASTHNAPAAAQTDSPAQAANQAQPRPKIFQPIDRARTVSDSMAARAARMNAATDSILH